MVPIDGTYTMSLDGVSEITKRLRSSVVLPMHRFATPLDEFMRLIGQQFVIDQRTRADAEDFAGHAAGHADGDHSGWGVSWGATAYRRHCERSEAIHGAASGGMDCFAALAMTENNEQQ